MSLTFTTEQDDLRRTVRDFLADSAPTTQVRTVMETDSALDRAVWDRAANELGLHGLAIPAEYGGAGAGLIEQLVVVEEMGKALFCGPYLGSVVLAATALSVAGDVEAEKTLLPGIADGSVIAALAITEDDGRWDFTATTVVADESGPEHLLTGHKNFVVDGAAADVYLVSASTPQGLSLFAVNASAPGVTRSRLETMDRTRTQVRLEFRDSPARLIGVAGGAGPVLQRVMNIGLALLAVEQVGVAQACLDMTVEYAKIRTQFSRPIGSFQAVKHRLTDMLVAVESARSAAYEAVRVSVEEPERLEIMAAMAKALSSEAVVMCTTESIQLHGGIGFTWEHDVHLYYRRAHSTAQLFGDPTYHRDRLGRLLGV